MFWKKKKPAPAPEPVVVEPVETLQRMVMVDLWYVDEALPHVLQSWTWQTVDESPDFPRSMARISSMSEHCQIHHWHIKEFERPVPSYIPQMVHPIQPVPN